MSLWPKMVQDSLHPGPTRAKEIKLKKKQFSLLSFPIEINSGGSVVDSFSMPDGPRERNVYPQDFILPT